MHDMIKIHHKSNHEEKLIQPAAIKNIFFLDLNQPR